MERFLYRVSKSRHAQSVILKGALLLKTIGIPNARPTMDIDMLRKGKADQPAWWRSSRTVRLLKWRPDGLTFLADSVVAEDITKDSEYKGTRILMDARMDNVRLKIQIDFGVGDVMVPGPRIIEYPVFLGSDTIHCLPIHRVLNRGETPGNGGTRQRQQPHEGLLRRLDLLEASRFQHGHTSQGRRATFKNRETPVPEDEFEALTTNFVEGHRVQWNAFVRKTGKKSSPIRSIRS